MNSFSSSDMMSDHCWCRAGSQVLAVSHFLRITIATPSRDQAKPPFEIRFGMTEDLTRFRTLGSRAWFRHLRRRRVKLQTSPRKGVLLGFLHNTTITKCGTMLTLGGSKLQNISCPCPTVKWHLRNSRNRLSSPRLTVTHLIRPPDKGSYSCELCCTTSYGLFPSFSYLYCNLPRRHVNRHNSTPQS
jgi:hypothetical protein